MIENTRGTIGERLEKIKDDMTHHVSSDVTDYHTFASAIKDLAAMLELVLPANYLGAKF